MLLWQKDWKAISLVFCKSLRHLQSWFVFSNTSKPAQDTQREQVDSVVCGGFENDVSFPQRASSLVHCSAISGPGPGLRHFRFICVPQRQSDRKTSYPPPVVEQLHVRGSAACVSPRLLRLPAQH